MWLYRKGRSTEGVHYLQSAVDQGFNNSLCFAYLAGAQASAGDLSAAEQTLARAVRVYPASVFLIVRHATALERNGRMPENVVFDNLEQLNLKLLPSLLDTATTLDPEFFQPYEYAAAVLPAVDVNEAIRIVQKGSAANPSNWKLYQHLGYLYWQKQDYKSAAEAYGNGAQIPGAPQWMQAMKARMLADGGSRSTAREIYLRMYEQSTDNNIRTMARHHVFQIDAADQLEVLQKVLAEFQTRNGRCTSGWKELQSELRTLQMPIDSTGAPVDPSGAPYVLATNCQVQLSPTSEVPAK